MCTGAAQGVKSTAAVGPRRRGNHGYGNASELIQTPQVGYCRAAGPLNVARQGHLDPACGATRRRDFEDRILGPDSGPDFGPTALYLTVGCGALGPTFWAGIWAQNPGLEIEPFEGGCDSVFLALRAGFLSAAYGMLDAKVFD